MIDEMYIIWALDLILTVIDHDDPLCHITYIFLVKKGKKAFEAFFKEFRAIAGNEPYSNSAHIYHMHSLSAINNEGY
tara:strand:+ start:15237 stop:15467 length:231 start_codon:yes stop_codon:yes gene_type:complete